MSEFGVRVSDVISRNMGLSWDNQRRMLKYFGDDSIDDAYAELEELREIGDEVHLHMASYSLNGRLREDPTEAYELAKRLTDAIVIAGKDVLVRSTEDMVESRLSGYGDLLGLSGAPDLVTERSGTYTIYDWKTASTPSLKHKVQISAYKLLLESALKLEGLNNFNVCAVLAYTPRKSKFGNQKDPFFKELSSKDLARFGTAFLSMVRTDRLLHPRKWAV